MTTAYDFLSDKSKRGAFDRGEIDADGNPKFAGFDFSGGRAGTGFRSAGGGFNAEDILKEFVSGFGGGARRDADMGGGWESFGGASRSARNRRPQKGHDVQIVAEVPLEDAHKACTTTIRLQSGRTLSVKLPAEVQEGQQIRLKGQGQPSLRGGEPGDALITVKFAPHRLFRRDGNDLRVDFPVTLYEAVLGSKVRVPTLDGKVDLTLPAGIDTSKFLRLKGKGFQGKGDLYIGIRIVLPKGSDADLSSLMRFWRDQKPYKVRE